MRKGQYQTKPANTGLLWTLVILLSIILIACIIAVMLMMRPTDKTQNDQAQVPVLTQPQQEQQTQPPVQTVPQTEPPTEPETEPATEPPTEPETEPETEPPTEPETEPETEPLSNLGEKIAALAEKQLGDAFEMGGSGPDTFDTSGLVYYCFRQHDIDAPRTVETQASYGEAVDKDDLLPGDVVFFWTDTEGKAQYVGIYIGDGQFVAARNSKYPVSLMELNSSYFKERYVCARRYWD